MSESQMDSKGGYDTEDAGGYMPQSEQSRQKPPSQHKEQTPDVNKSSPIDEKEFNASEYKVCPKIGKAIIVSNFMQGYEPQKDENDKSKDPARREYASADCENLKAVLQRLGFEPLTNEEMVHKNLSKSQFTELYKKAAQEENYRPQSGGYTCVLFIVMSYGRSGLIKCHAEKPGGNHEFAEQKDMQEAFQPQNNNSLALKPKIFIVQTIPEETDAPDNSVEGEFKITTKRIPREADFLTYSSDSYCLRHEQNPENTNYFVRAIVDTLEGLAEDQKEKRPALEIQRLLIKMNNHFKKKKKEKSADWKIPCVTSSLTKQLKLF